MKKYSVSRFILVLICALSFNYSHAQSILMNEEFNDGSNWSSNISVYKTKIVISSGRCNLENNSEENCLYTTYKQINENNNFTIEALITMLPPSKKYQGIVVEKVYEHLKYYNSLYNYTKKYSNSVVNGINHISDYQAQGIRFDLLTNKGNYSYYFADAASTTQIKNNNDLANAMGFIQNIYSQGHTDILINLEACGIIWGSDSKNEKNFFEFSIFPDVGKAIVTQCINGTYMDIIDINSSAILKVNHPNKLTVLSKDEMMYFYVNDKQIGETPKQQFYGHYLGFIFTPNSKVSIDRMKITAKNPSQQAPSTDNFIGNGSGLIISESGYIVTNNHVVESAKEIWVEYSTGQTKKLAKAKIVLQDNNNDLAILKIENAQLSKPKFKLKTENVDVGTDAFAMGYPLTSSLGEELKITDGIISSKTGYQGDISLYQISVPIQPGNSGGPLFDKKGSLLGITSGGIPGADNCGYAVKISFLKNLLDLLPERIDFPSNTELENLSFTEQIKALSGYVVQIKIK